MASAFAIQQAPLKLEVGDQPPGVGQTEALRDGSTDRSARRVFSQDPGCHGALILHDGGFYRIEELPAPFDGEPMQQSLIHQISLRTVGQQKSAFSGAANLPFDADGRCQPAKEESSRSERAPCTAQHGFEVIVVLREVEYGAAQYHIRKAVREGHRFQGFDSKVAFGELRRQGRRETAHAPDGVWIGIHAEDFVPFPQEVKQIASFPAAGVQDAHAWRDTAAEKLVEEIDIDTAELFPQVQDRVYLVPGSPKQYNTLS
jgi:hypothetical protein